MIQWIIRKFVFPVIGPVGDEHGAKVGKEAEAEAKDGQGSVETHNCASLQNLTELFRNFDFST